MYNVQFTYLLINLECRAFFNKKKTTRKTANEKVKLIRMRKKDARGVDIIQPMKKPKFQAIQ